MRGWPLLLIYRPIFRCPLCKGTGGVIISTPDGLEWSDCGYCHRYWDATERWGLKWTAGRVPPVAWLGIRLAVHWAMPPERSIRRMVACRLGWHLWMYEPDFDARICAVCYHWEHLGEEDAA